MTTLDYDGESAAPPPVSQTVEKYLSRSISISEVLSRILRSWLFAAIGVLLGAVIGIYAIWATPPSYAVSLTLLPLEGGSADIGGGGGDSGLGVIASLLGTSGSVPKFTRFVAALYTTSLASAMDKRYDTICTMNAACDRKTRVWRKSTGLNAWIARTTARIAHLPDPDRPSTAADLAAYIRGNVTISTDKARMLVLSMDTRDPDTARTFLVDLVNTANDYIKDQDNQIVKKEVAYVTEQLKTNTNVEQRAALTGMLSSQENHLMLTAVDLPYVASIQDGPNVEISNNAIKFLAAYTMLGLLLGGGVGVVMTFIPGYNRLWRRFWKRS